MDLLFPGTLNLANVSTPFIIVSSFELLLDLKLGNLDPEIGSSNESYEGMADDVFCILSEDVGPGERRDMVPKSLLALEFHPLVAAGEGNDILANVVLKLSSV